MGRKQSFCDSINLSSFHIFLPFGLEALTVIFAELTREYSALEAWFHERFIAERVLYTQSDIFEREVLSDVFAEGTERSMLDIGCGGGQMVIRLKQRYPHLRLWGIDLSEALIARARKRGEKMGGSLQFEIANAQDLPFSDESFDVIFSMFSVKHWPDPLQGIGECWRVLKAGGELLLVDTTSDATQDQVMSFIARAPFPKLLKKPAATLAYRRLVRPSSPVEAYRQSGTQLGIPHGAVRQLRYLPAFLFRTQKPQPQT